MKIIKLSKEALNRHLAIWFCLITYITFVHFNTGTGSFASKLFYVLIFTFNFVIPYYILLLYVFPNFFEKRKILFVLGYVLVMVLFVSMDYIHLKKILPFFGGRRLRSDYSLYDFISSSLLHFSFLAFPSLGAYLNWRSIERLKEGAKKEKDIISRELCFLSNQFHSHLTFNFLNFCYSKMLRYSPQAAESIEDFSGMLQYSLSNRPNEYVPLKKEIDYIEHFIAIQKCIMTKVFIELKSEGNTSNYFILPMMLAVFVENSFKHGVFNDPEYPISILLSVKNDDLLFCIKNKKNGQKPILSTGIGLQNVKQLLKLFYQNKHSLIIEETETTYCTELNLKLALAL